MSRKLAFALVAFVLSSLLVWLGSIGATEWAAVCGAVVTVYLGGQAYVDKTPG
jgi:hypothetical protein